MSTPHKNIINEGARIRQVLKDKGIKVIDFAARAGFSNQIAHYYLRKESIKRAKLVEFCEFINISLDDFYSWRQQPATDEPEETHHGKRLSTLIDQKGINKTKLAKRAGLSRRALYNLLEREVLTSEQLRKILPALEMTAGEFFSPKSSLYDGGTGYNQPEAWREKYYRSLEDYKSLTQEIATLRQENERLRATIESMGRSPDK